MKLLFSVIVFFTLLSFTRDNITGKASQKFAHFIVEGADTQLEAKKIDTYMRGQAGVVMSRMDIVSNKYLVLYTYGMGYDQAYFEETFTKLGFEITCFRDGTKGVDRIFDPAFTCK